MGRLHGDGRCGLRNAVYPSGRILDGFRRILAGPFFLWSFADWRPAAHLSGGHGPRWPVGASDVIRLPAGRTSILIPHSLVEGREMMQVQIPPALPVQSSRGAGNTDWARGSVGKSGGCSTVPHMAVLPRPLFRL